MILPPWLIPTAGPLLIAMIVAFVVLTGDRWVRQYGRRNRRQRRRLAATVDGWPRGKRAAVVRWHDYSSLTKLDIAEVLHEQGWYLRGQHIDGDGWPLSVTRDVWAAESGAAPLPREQLLIAELRAASAGPSRSYLLDLVPYWSLPRGRVSVVARRIGWEVGGFPSYCTPTMRLVRLDVLVRDEVGGLSDGGQDV